MKIQDIMAILGVAAATMAFTIGFAASGPVDAVDQAENASNRITPLIGQPTLEIAGLEISLAMDKPNYAPGDKPVVTLETTNPTDQRVETNVWIGMTSSSPSSFRSRALTMPSYFWTQNVPLALGPGETKQFQVATEKEFVAGKSIAVTMSHTDEKAALAKLLKPIAAARASNAEAVVPVTPDNAFVARKVPTRVDGR